MTKRILIFSLTYFPYVGGAEVAIKEITDRLDDGDMAFEMVTLRFDKNLPKEEMVGNVKVHRVGFSEREAKVSDKVSFKLKFAKLLFPFTSFFKAQSLYKKEKYDAIWVMMANHGAFGALWFKLLNKDVPYLLTLQDGQTTEEVMKKNPILKIIYPMYLSIFTNADHIQVISHFLKQLAIDIGVKAPVSVIPNGVDVALFSKDFSITKLDKLRDRLNMRKSKRYLITTSRLVLSRGVEDVIRALEYLPDYIDFLVLGSGNDRGSLEKIATDVKVGDRVHFIGHVEHKNLPRYLKIADIFIRPSTIEGFGNSFVEAMAAGIPVIATPVGGIVDFLYDPEKNPDHRPTGLFCRVRDPQGIAVVVRRLLDNPDLADELSSNAQALAKERYEWDKVAIDMKRDVFDRLHIVKKK